MKKLKVLALYMVIIGLFWSCQKKEITKEIPQEVTVLPTKNQLLKLKNMGINTNNVILKDITTPDSITTKYLVSGDIIIPVEELDHYANLKALDSVNKQYIELNLVTGTNKNIDILGYVGDGYALTNKMQIGLQWAVNNYNALGNTLSFNLSFGEDIATADIVVYKLDDPRSGGFSGFPNKDGEPNKFIAIFSGTNDLTFNVNEHVIGHEIGHAVGLRHQDWFDHQSCDYEGSFPVEPSAIWISGTALSSSEDSIMLACFGPNEDGELTASDIQALHKLY